MSEERCNLTELFVSQCACRKHRNKELPDVETVGPSFEATYSGCCARCEERIKPGHIIKHAADSFEYVHVTCPQ